MRTKENAAVVLAVFRAIERRDAQQFTGTRNHPSTVEPLGGRLSRVTGGLGLGRPVVGFNVQGQGGHDA
jgi:hypothetical protein